MSLGYCGICNKQREDEYMAIYSYAGENWNDDGKSKSDDCMLQDGSIVIYKECLQDPGPSIAKCLSEGTIVIEKECKNAFCRPTYIATDYIACKLISKILSSYQTNGRLPEKENFII